MPKLDPQRLIALRGGKDLTRQQLAEDAKVSERQLARIETAADAASVRSNTLERLARALKIDVQVLTGEKALPEFAQEERDLEINPETLMRLRRKRKWSRRELAEKCGVSERHIARLETSRPSVRPTTINKIARALKTDKKTLTGDDGVDTPEAQDVQMGLKVSPQLRLAFDLVGRRYGISRREVVELAPLLFTLMAEGCLAWRRECLQEVEDAMARLRGFSEMSQFGFAGLVHDVETGCDVEADSISQADLLGDVVRKDGWFSGSDYPNRVTPFADYLCKLAEDLKIEGIVDFFPWVEESFVTVGFDKIWGAEPYQVCRNDLAELAGDSKTARWALALGDVQLSKVPKELLATESAEARVQWLESKVSDETRSLRDDWEKVWSGLDQIQISVDIPISDESAADEGSR